MILVNNGLSEKLFSLFLDWQQEYETNIQHDTNEVNAWNALVKHLMELEKGAVEEYTIS